MDHLQILDSHRADTQFPKQAVLVTLFVTALPFIWLGLLMTLRRLRDAGLPPWLALLFFAPFVNVIFFAVLCILPPNREIRSSDELRGGEPNAREGNTDSRWGSAALAVLSSALLGAFVAFVIIRWFGIYGRTLFMALPFVMGYLAVWIHSRHRTLQILDVFVLVTFSTLLAGVMIAAIAIEGLICVAMAAPIAWILGLIGGLMAFGVHNDRQNRLRKPGQALGAVLLSLPFLISAEKIVPAPVPQVQVHTSIEIAAPPEVVWNRVISFPALPTPTAWPFRLAGIAYPIEARINGEGLTADRQCRFSTGNFKEPILAWEPGKHFAFGVADEPLLMTELSPYGKIHVRHLEDHDFQPERADFTLTKLPNGSTRLEGTTVYRNKMWPGEYWHLWTDGIIHAIHQTVFKQVKKLAEDDVKSLTIEARTASK
jgi:hypothetical protein